MSIQNKLEGFWERIWQLGLAVTSMAAVYPAP